MGTIESDRTAHLVMASDGADYHLARRRLDSASIRIKLGSSAMTRWGQAALLVLVACGSRMFPRGVYVELDHNTPCLLPLYSSRTLARVAKIMGAAFEDIPEDSVRIQIGEGDLGGADLYCGASDWTARLDSRPFTLDGANACELAGGFAAAIAASAAFRFKVLGDPVALRRPQKLTLWEDAPSLSAEYLPTALWFIGLGNLGQAALLLLSFLPYRDAGAVKLLLQDFDLVGPENIQVQVLTRPEWLHKFKTRMIADWAERLGFETTISERRFRQGDGPGKEEPTTAIVGVDNLEARRLVAAAPFSFVVDAGLGATAAEAFDLRVHAFPGAKSPEDAWPDLADPDPITLTPALQSLVREGAISKCGAMLIAGKSVSVPCTAVAAAALQLTQVLRAIAGVGYADLADVSLRDCKRSTFHLAMRKQVIPFQRALGFDSDRTRPE